MMKKILIEMLDFASNVFALRDYVTYNLSVYFPLRANDDAYSDDIYHFIPKMTTDLNSK